MSHPLPPVFQVGTPLRGVRSSSPTTRTAHRAVPTLTNQKVFHTVETFLPLCGKIEKHFSILWKTYFFLLTFPRGRDGARPSKIGGTTSVSSWFVLQAALILFALHLAPSAFADTPPGFYVANWNVENLFDTLDDPDNPYDDEFLPNNPTTRWTRVRYETKLNNLAQVIRGMNNTSGPDLLGLQEVENDDVVRDLVEKLKPTPYGIVHVDSPDPRGIDTALLFNRHRFSLLEFHANKVSLQESRTTRDILHAVFEDRDGKKIHAFVNHWPSRGGGIEISEPNRFAAARTLSKAIARVFQREPQAHIVVLGDFNDEPTSQSIRVVLNVAPYPSRTGYIPTRLYNLSSPTSAKGWGSFFHAFGGNIEWRMYDQIIVSGALLQNARMEQDLFWVTKPDYMLKEKGREKGSPVPTFENQEYYLGGYSDHFPVGARFIYLNSTPQPRPDDPIRW